MKCMVTTISILLPSVLFCFFISPSVFAVDDVTYTVDSNSTYPFYLCYSTDIPDVPHCPDYDYIITEPDSQTWVSSRLTYTGIRSNSLQVPLGTDSIVKFDPDVWWGSNTAVFLSNAPAVLPITITLTDKTPTFGSSIPSGSLSITENGTYDVTDYAEAVVDVPTPDPEIVQGDYHDDLVNIQHAILLCGGVILVLYFFYCIYRMIIKPMGGF